MGSTRWSGAPGTPSGRGFGSMSSSSARPSAFPWHCHTSIHDTFYVLEGQLRLYLRDPKEQVDLGPGETYAVRARRPIS